MSKLCPNCHYIGKGKYGNFLYEFLFCSLSLGLMFIGLGIYNLITRYDTPFPTTESALINILTYIVYIVFFSFPFVWGIINIANYFRGGKTCPKCNNKGMLPLDNPESIRLIKELDLKVGEQTSKESSKQST